MSTATAHLNHDTHHATGERTWREWAERTGRIPDNMMRTVRRKLPHQNHSLDDLVSADHFYTTFPPVRQQGTDKPQPTQRTTGNQKPETPKPKPSSAHPFPTYRRPILYILMAMPAVASIQNMYSVSGDIVAHTFTAILLTGLFSATPFLFVLAGMRNHWTKALAASMIAYECFCNVTRIYGGLTGFGHGDFPTRFLGLVCDIFNTGTYATAKTLAVIMAAMAAAVFYTAYNELNRR